MLQTVRRYTRFLYSTLAIFILFESLPALRPNSAQAEFRCRSRVEFKWRRTEEEKENVVFWKSMEEKGEDQEKAKRAVELASAPEKEKAREACAVAHERPSACISAKFASNAQAYGTMGFGARKAIEEAITKECANSQGVCTEVTTSEIVCEEVLAKAAEGAAETPAKETKGKEKDTKKKK